MSPKQVLPLLVRVDLGVMTMNEYSCDRERETLPQVDLLINSSKGLE